jgi:hypothetical protein
MDKVKIFVSNDADKLADGINSFIEKESFELVDIKLSVSRIQIVCIVIYKTAL